MKSHLFGKRRGLLAACSLVSLALAASAAAADPSRLIVAADIPATLPGAVPVAAPATSAPMTVDIALPLTDEAAAAAFADKVSTPGNALYGHYLTPAQFAAQYGANADDYAAVTAWAKSAGLAVRPPNSARTLVSVVGTAAQIEHAFGVKFNYYQDKTGRVFPSANRQPSLPASIAPRISSVLGLSRQVGKAPMLRRAPANTFRPQIAGGSGIGGGYAPADFRTAYTIPSPALKGPAETMAVFEQGGYFASDVTTFLKANSLAMPKVTVRNVDGYTGVVDDPDVELESVLDIQTIIGVTQSQASILVYENGDDFNIALVDSLVAMADDDKASIISISYGQDEVLAGTHQMKVERTALIQLAAQGQTVLASAGDEGAYGDTGFGLHVSDPCAQVYVTCVGGTTLMTGTQSQWGIENVWNDLASYDGATGGGTSSIWTLPKWQVQPDQTPTAPVGGPNGASATYRNVPDLSADADPFTGAAIYSAMNGGWLLVGGTSLSSPIWAGYLATYDQTLQIVGKPHIGFFNPALYAFGTNFESYYGFHDVRNGSNGDANEYGVAGYSAGYDYDLASGWGSMVGSTLTSFLLSNVTGYKHPPAAPNAMTGKISGSTITVSWKPVAGVPGYIAELVNPYLGSLIASAASVGTSAKFTNIPAGLGYYAVYLFSINATGSTEGPPIYLQAPAAN